MYFCPKHVQKMEEKKTLPPNWFAEGLIDLEYKQYVLLDYLQSVRNRFTEMKLYPPLAELIDHLRALQAYRQQKQDFEANIPRRIIGFNPQEGKVVYESNPLPEPDKLAEIDEIVDFSLPHLEQHLAEGRNIYELVEHELKLEPIGILPMYKQEGYLLIRCGSHSRILAFRYGISLFSHGEERLAGINTQYVTSFSYSLGQTYDQMKLQLVRKHRDLPNPATYLAETNLQLPLAETLMPVAKRRLLASVSRG